MSGLRLPRVACGDPASAMTASGDETKSPDLCHRKEKVSVMSNSPFSYAVRDMWLGGTAERRTTGAWVRTNYNDGGEEANKTNDERFSLRMRQSNISCLTVIKSLLEEDVSCLISGFESRLLTPQSLLSFLAFRPNGPFLIGLPTRAGTEAGSPSWLLLRLSAAGDMLFVNFVPA
jgi:hypothetical protein